MFYIFLIKNIQKFSQHVKSDPSQKIKVSFLSCSQWYITHFVHNGKQ